MNSREAQRFLTMILDQSDIEIARDLFHLAWRCQELQRKNARLLRLVDKFVEISSDTFADKARKLSSTPDDQLPDSGGFR